MAELERARDAMRALADTALRDAPLRLGPRLSGGRNNLVFAVDGGGPPLCVKVYRSDRRNGVSREATILTALETRLPGRVPRLIAADEQRACLLMTRLPGRPLAVEDVTGPAQEAVLETLLALYSLPAPDAPVPAVCWSPLSMFERVKGMIYESYGVEARSAWAAAAERLALVELLQPGRRRACFGRGDPALDNVLWDGSRACLVDFESAGSSDVAHEVAEFLEHPQQRALTAEFRRAVAMRILRADDLAALAASRWLLRSFWALRSAGVAAEQLLRDLEAVPSLASGDWR